MDISLESLPLDLPQMNSSIIKVIGVGGGGGNAVNHMYNQGIRDVSFVVCNTDNQALKSSPVPVKIQLGEDTTAGLGAGGKPEVARSAAEESIEAIQNVLRDNTKMVFITAGMGGGTGTGASPVVAKAAHDLGILTVGIVTIPFAFEGNLKIRQALEGVASLSEHVDALLVINNQKLTEIFPDFELSNAFAKADDVLTNAAKGIAEIITVPGYINTDFADVYTILKEGNVAIMNTGFAEGENRITNAIVDALNSPLLNTNQVNGASKVLLSLYCSKQNQIRMEEVAQINEFMASVGDNVQVIWGATFDDSLGESVKITLIATGYKVSDIPGMPVRKTKQTENTESANDVAEELASSAAPETKAGADIDKALESLYGKKQELIEELPLESEPEEIIEELSPMADPKLETVDIFDFEDEKNLDKMEKIPAWKRKFMNRK